MLWCSSSRRQHQILTSPVRIGSTYVLRVTSVRDLGLYIDCDASLQTHITATVRSCFAALRQIRSVRRYVSPTERPAVAHPCVSRQQGRLLLLIAGWRLPSLVVQAAVHSQRRCSTCILDRQAFGAHHSASPRASLAAGSGTDNIPSLRFDTPLPQRISAGIPRREHSSDGRWKAAVIYGHPQQQRL